MSYDQVLIFRGKSWIWMVLGWWDSVVFHGFIAGLHFSFLLFIIYKNINFTVYNILWKCTWYKLYSQKCHAHIDIGASCLLPSHEDLQLQGLHSAVMEMGFSFSFFDSYPLTDRFRRQMLEYESIPRQNIWMVRQIIQKVYRFIHSISVCVFSLASLPGCFFSV